MNNTERTLLASLIWLKKITQMNPLIHEDNLWQHHVETGLSALTLSEKEELKNQHHELLRLQRKENLQFIFSFDKKHPLVDPDEKKLFPVLTFQGEEPFGEYRESITVVGSRNPEDKIQNWILTEFKNLPKNITLFSGGAHGVDQMIHRCALLYQIKTTAVLPCGLLQIYPPQFKELSKLILKQKGILLSPFDPRSSMKKFYFHQRNYLLALLCPKTVVLQGGVRSGTLITARFALEKGREVFVLPQFPTARTTGGLTLIKEGAQLITEMNDVITYSSF